MMQALLTILTVSTAAALLLASVVRASRKGELLAGTVGQAWQWWLIYRPGWLSDKASGDCAFCACFWGVGVPLALFTGLVLLSGWAALLSVLVAPFTALLFERLISR